MNNTLQSGAMYEISRCLSLFETSKRVAIVNELRQKRLAPSKLEGESAREGSASGKLINEACESALPLSIERRYQQTLLYKIKRL